MTWINGIGADKNVVECHFRRIETCINNKPCSSCNVKAGLNFTSIPKQWSKGKIEGVLLRGGVLLKELSWDDKKIHLVLNAKKAQKLNLQFPSEVKTVKGLSTHKSNSKSIQLQLKENKEITLDILIN